MLRPLIFLAAIATAGQAVSQVPPPADLTLLPVTVLFKVSVYNNQPKLTFTIYTVSEEETATIERSTNGNDFVEISHIPLPESGSYSYIDGTVLSGVIYYRLRFFDARSNVTTYSQVRMINMNEMEVVKTYPNPVRDQLLIKIPPGLQGKVISISILDATGNKIRDQFYKSAPADATFNVSALRQGIYYLRLFDSHESGCQLWPIFITN